MEKRRIYRLLPATILCLLLAPAAFSMDAKEVISHMQETYAKAERLEYTCTYELFKGHEGEDLSTSYSGRFYKEGSEQYQKIGPSEYVYGRDFFLAINHEEKELMLRKAQKAAKPDMDLQGILASCSSTNVKEEGKNYRIELVFGPTSAAGFSSVVLLISRSDYQLHQIDLYYAGQQDFAEDDRPEDLHQPHLRIAFSAFDLKPKRHPELLDLSTYSETTNGTPVPKAFYAGYTLTDNRPK